MLSHARTPQLPHFPSVPAQRNEALHSNIRASSRSVSTLLPVAMRSPNSLSCLLVLLTTAATLVHCHDPAPIVPTTRLVGGHQSVARPPRRVAGKTAHEPVAQRPFPRWPREPPAHRSEERRVGKECRSRW